MLNGHTVLNLETHLSSPSTLQFPIASTQVEPLFPVLMPAVAVSATGALKSCKVSELHDIVLKGREAYQRLIQATSTDYFDGIVKVR